MLQERLPKQALLAKVKRKRPVGRPRTRWAATLRILDGTTWGFNKAKCWKWWRTVMCGGSTLSCCPRNPHGHERALKEEEKEGFSASLRLNKFEFNNCIKV